jgi:hypothetical protein
MIPGAPKTVSLIAIHQASDHALRETGMNDLEYANAVDQVIDRVRQRKLPGDRHSVWDSILSQFGRNGLCDARLVDIIEEEIRAYLGSLKGPSLRRLWSWAAEGMAESTDCAGVPTEQMRMFLEIDFLDCISELARDEVGLR